MPTRVITITSGKGGVGKTTTTANLGVALAKLGKRVVVVDTDIGLRNLDVLMGLQNRIIYDIVDLIEGRCRLRQALIRDKLMPELYLLPAAQSRDKSAVSPADMIRVCGQLRGECDFVLVDSPAGIESGFRNAVAAADEFILLVTPDPASLAPDDILKTLSIDLLGIVPEAEEILVSNNRGVPVAHDLGSLVGKAYQNIARRLLGERVPFIPILEGRKGFLARLGFKNRTSR